MMLQSFRAVPVPHKPSVRPLDLLVFCFDLSSSCHLTSRSISAGQRYIIRTRPDNILIPRILLPRPDNTEIMKVSRLSSCAGAQLAVLANDAIEPLLRSFILREALLF